MQNVRTKLNRRLLTVILGISVALAVLVASFIVSEKAWPVRVIDNLFLGAVMNLSFMLFFRMRSGHEAKANAEAVARRSRGKLAKQERGKLSRYDTFRLFTRHFGWSSLILFVLSGLGTVFYTMLR